MTVEIEINIHDAIEFVESRGYKCIDIREYDNLIDTEEIIWQLECKGYYISKPHIAEAIERLDKYVIKNSLNNIQIDELLDKILL